MSAEGLTATEAGLRLQSFGLEAEQATGRVRRWRMGGILPPAGRDYGGKTAAFKFDKGQVACAAVLFWLHDNAGLTDHAHLRALHDMLATPRPGGNVALIDAILAEIERDADEPPFLLVTCWRNPEGDTGKTYTVRLAGEYEMPIVAPGPEWQPIMDGLLSLAPLLAPFIKPTVVPFPTKLEAAN